MTTPGLHTQFARLLLVIVQRAAIAGSKLLNGISDGVSSIFFWSIRTAICPEAYVHLKISPSETANWTIRYRFYAR